MIRTISFVAYEIKTNQLIWPNVFSRNTVIVCHMMRFKHSRILENALTLQHFNSNTFNCSLPTNMPVKSKTFNHAKPHTLTLTMTFFSISSLAIFFSASKRPNYEYIFFTRTIVFY